MTSKLQKARPVLIPVVIAAMMGTLGVMAFALQQGGIGKANWRHLASGWNPVEQKRQETRTTAVPPGKSRLFVMTDGQITVTPSPDGQLHVVALLHGFGSTADEAKQALKDIRWKIDTGVGDGITVDAKQDGGTPQIRVNGNTWGRHPRIDLTIQAPPGMKVTAETDSGDLTVTGMASAHLTTDNGDVEALRIAGDLQVKTDNGSATIRDVGGQVHVDVDSGRLLIERVKGRVHAKADSGSITVQQAGGSELQTDHGRIEATGINGDLSAETSSGSLTVQDVSGSSDLRTEHGRIAGTQLRGNKVAARTETGSIQIAQSGVVGPSYDLRTEHGRIELTLPADASVAVNALTGHGGIDSDLKLTDAIVNKERGDGDTLTGKLNGGAKTLYAETETGGITLRTSGKAAKPS